MKKNTVLILSILIFTLSCSDYLEVKPSGVLSASQLNNPENIEKMAISAYAFLSNDHYNYPFSLWPYGNVRSDDAYKGGNGTNDVSSYHYLETFTNLRDNLSQPDQLWYRLYSGISRANATLSLLNNMAETDFSLKDQRIAEMRFLRGLWYLKLKLVFNRVPWIDETVQYNEISKVSNVELTNQQLWEKIKEDFEYAASILPENQSQPSRPTKYAAKGFLAKVLLYMSYEQDEAYKVVNINKNLLNKVVELCDEIIASGKYGLLEDYAYNFLPDYDNSKEGIFEIQYSIDDGVTVSGKFDWSHVLSNPMDPNGYGCCGFHIPSHDLTNSFRTDENGLPVFNNYNSVKLETLKDFRENTVDPRVDHTVASLDKPFKYVPEKVLKPNFSRLPGVYGYFLSLKEIAPVTCDCIRKNGAFYSSSMNRKEIRFAEILLWKAEALIELGREKEALPLINQIRERAKNSTSMLIDIKGDPTSNYKIELYEDGVNCTWSNDFAREALRRETRLEFAMEGHRFFNLMRWGIAESVINNYFAYESKFRNHLSTAHFTSGRDEFVPIPFAQIQFSEGLYQQNPGGFD